MTDACAELLLIDAFTDRAFAGNPAGVVLRADALDESQMQKIAREVHASETAFVTAFDGRTASVRYFTPRCEVDYCGHATVAAMAALAWEGRLEVDDVPVTVQLATHAGQMACELRPHPYFGVEVIQTQARPRFADFGYRVELLAGALGLDAQQIPKGWPLGRAYTGLWALVVPVASRKAIDSARPDFAALADLDDKLGCASTHLYTYQGERELYCRDFSPAVGVPEDPVTGSASGAAAALLLREGAIAATPPITVILFEQGCAMGRPGRVRVEVDHEGESISAVRIAGTAVLVLRGQITVPPQAEKA
ncbi:MAG: PhzF family phenazine biosynthesis protein [Deltaproteobacteria bacterium]|nr:PhzF family phenazine biosynthesis protein [Deltaproteobacteria bacterium]